VFQKSTELRLSSFDLSFNSSKSTSSCLVVNVVVLPLKDQGFKIEILNGMLSEVYVWSMKNIKKWRNLINFSKCLIFQASRVWPLPWCTRTRLMSTSWRWPRSQSPSGSRTFPSPRKSCPWSGWCPEDSRLRYLTNFIIFLNSFSANSLNILCNLNPITKTNNLSLNTRSKFQINRLP